MNPLEEMPLLPGVGFRWRPAGTGYVAEWEGIVTVRIDAAGTIREVDVNPGAALEAVEKVRSGAAAAFARFVAGGFSLHSSAACDDGGAVVCVGPSGVGKSTVMSFVCSSYGLRLLADDVAGLSPVDGIWHVLPSEKSVWLQSPSSAARAKHPSARAAALAPARISSVVALAFDDSALGLEVRQLRPVDAAAELLSSLMRFATDAQHMLREVELAAAIERQAPVFRVVRPHVTPPEEVAAEIVRLNAGAPTT
jgi:hypothetical protein